MARQGAGKIAHTKAYLFAIARNATLAIFRRQRISPEIPVADLGGLRILEDKPDVIETVSAGEELAFVSEAIGHLPPRCREIVTLRAVHGLSYEQIAEKLALSPHTVRVQMAKGVKSCVKFFRERDITRY